jgi:hypothetical protein
VHVFSGAFRPKGPARPNQATGDFIMSTKTKTPKTPKTPAKPKAKKTKTTTLDAGGGILVDVVEAIPEAPASTAATTKAKKEPKAKKPSGLDLVAQVLKAKGEPMPAKDIAEAVIAAGWQTKGKTPAATLYSAMLREIDGKPSDSRFVKTGRGLFALTNNAKA